MRLQRRATLAMTCCAALALSGCGGNFSSDVSGLFGSGATQAPLTADEAAAAGAVAAAAAPEARKSTLGDLFNNSADPNTTVEVNKYLWVAALDVLNFLPIESVDPFTGVIVTGYGTPPGGGRAYRATIYIQDPALDARSLKIALQASGGGAVDPETVRAVEDAILTRARQLRIADSNL